MVKVFEIRLKTRGPALTRLDWIGCFKMRTVGQHSRVVDKKRFGLVTFRKVDHEIVKQIGPIVVRLGRQCWNGKPTS